MGQLEICIADTTVYGNYFTVWKKQSDENWKMLLDADNGALSPEESDI